MNSLVQKAAKGFSILMIVRVFSRFIDFFLNIIVIRKIDPSIYGLTTHLGLLTNFSLFYLKVCLKQAYQRRCTTISETAQQNVIMNSAKNMMLFGGVATIFITSFISVIIGYYYAQMNEYFIYSCVLHGIAAVIEAAAEPLTVRFILTFNYTVPAQAETISVFLKTLVLYILCIPIGQHPLIAFGYSQIVFSVSILLVQLYHALKYQSLKDLFTPTKINENSYIQADMKEMGFQFTLMAFLKFLLQELEKIIIVTFRKNDSTVSAEFSLVSHIGALVPRFIYSPIEDVSYNLFSKMASDKNEKDRNSEAANLIETIPEVSTNDNLKTQLDYLKKILVFINTLGIAFIFAGIPMSKTFIKILYGDQWLTSSCVTALQTFCIYEWVMGINGITESFVNGNLKSKEMANYRGALMIITTIYIISSLFLIEFGATGIIIANIISMICRIALSIKIISNKCFFGSVLLFFTEMKSSFPAKKIWMMYILTNLGFHNLLNHQTLEHQIIRLGCFVLIFSFSIIQIKPTILQLYNSKNQ